MTQKIINVGTGPNSKNGDPLRNAFIKINENFTEVYSSLSGNFEQVNSDWDANTGVTQILNKPIIPGDVSDLTDTQGLLSSGTANTGDVTFSGIKIIGAGTESGDGNGYSTLELVPDNNLYANNQYLVIDPTQPNHIHIRAGGTQDASNAELYLGGERTYVRVSDNGGVRLENDEFSLTFYNFQQGMDYDTAVWSTDESGNYWLDINITDPMNPTRSSTPFDVPFYSFAQFLQNRIEVFDGTNFIDLIGNGQAYTLGNQYQLRLGITQAPTTNPTSLPTLSFRINTLNQSSLSLENNSFNLAVNNDAYVYASQTIQLTTGTGSIQITTDDNTSSRSWTFGSNGSITFPDASIQTTAYAGLTDTLDTITDRGAITTNNITVGAVLTTDITNVVAPSTGTQVTGVRAPEGAGANNGYVWIPDITELSSLGDITGYTISWDQGQWTTTVVQMRNDFGTAWAIETVDAFPSYSPGTTYTYTYTSPTYTPSTPLPLDVNVGTNTWTFSTDGSILFPGGMSIQTTYSGGNRLIIDGSQGDGYLQLDSSAAVLIGTNSNGSVSIGNPEEGTWTEIVSRKVLFGNQDIPVSSTGKPGDMPGQVAFDSSFIYYCAGLFNGITYNVVHNIAEGTANGVDNGYLVSNTYQLPQVGWKVYYNGEVSTINQVNNGGIPGFYVVFVDNPLVIPGQATFAWGPVSVTNIWKRVSWSNDTW